MTKRKLVSLLLAIAVLFTVLSPSVYAAGTENAVLLSATTEYNATLSLYSDTSTFCSIFQTSASAIVPAELSASSENAKNTAPVIGNVRYNYVINMDISGCGVATLNYTLCIDGTEYPATVCGNVSEIILNEKYTIITGALKGVLVIADKEYRVDAYLRKLTTSETLNVGITITSFEAPTSGNIQQVIVGFGTSIMSDDVLEAYKGYINTQNSQLLDAVKTSNVTGYTVSPMSASASTLTRKAIANGYTLDNGTVYNSAGAFGQKIVTHYDKSNERVILSLYSNVSGFDQSDFVKGGTTATFIKASVHQYTMGVVRVGLSTEINNFENVPENVTKSNNNLYDFFAGIISIVDEYGIYANIMNLLRLMLSTAEGDIVTYNNGNHSYVRVTIDTSEMVNFDTTPMVIGVNFVIDSGETGTYYSYSEMSYLVDCLEIGMIVYTSQARTSNYSLEERNS